MKTPTRSSRTASHDAPSYHQTFPLLLHYPDPRRTPREVRRALPFGAHGRALRVPVRGTQLCLHSTAKGLPDKACSNSQNFGLDSKDAGVNKIPGVSGDKVGGEAAGRAGVKKEESVGHQHPEHPRLVPGGGRGVERRLKGRSRPGERAARWPSRVSRRQD